jgi:hypothetical protein
MSRALSKEQRALVNVVARVPPASRSSIASASDWLLSRVKNCEEPAQNDHMLAVCDALMCDACDMLARHGLQPLARDQLRLQQAEEAAVQPPHLPQPPLSAPSAAEAVETFPPFAPALTSAFRRCHRRRRLRLPTLHGLSFRHFLRRHAPRVCGCRGLCRPALEASSCRCGRLRMWQAHPETPPHNPQLHTMPSPGCCSPSSDVIVVDRSRCAWWGGD